MQCRRLIFHIFPAHTADVLLRLMGKTPKMIKAVEKLDRVCDMLGFALCLHHNLLQLQLFYFIHVEVGEQ